MNISKYQSRITSPPHISTKRESSTTSTLIWIQRDQSLVSVKNLTPRSSTPSLRQKKSESGSTCGRKTGPKRKECRVRFITITCGKLSRYFLTLESILNHIQEEKKTGKNQAELYYKKTSLVNPKKLNRYLQAGAIYRNNDIRDYLLKLSKELHSSLSPGDLLKEHNSRAASSKHKYSTCSRAPHFQCDHKVRSLRILALKENKDCCFHLRSPMFTFEKRLLGYIRYDAFEWWKKGITWPPRSQH